jgi:predicted helicase
VFDIQQGVCIIVAAKSYKNTDIANVRHVDIFGLQNRKYEFLLHNKLSTTDFKPLLPTSPWYLFYPQSLNFEKEYEKCIKLQDIFTNSNTGIQTKQDALFVDIDVESLHSRMNDVIDNVSSSTAQIRTKYGLEDSSGWQVSKLYNLKYSRNKIFPILYKPFDKRFIYFEPKALGRARYSTMQHMLHPNVGLLSTRQITSLPFNHVFVSPTVTEEKTASHDRTTQLFPLFLYSSPDELPGISKESKSTALSFNAIREFEKSLNLKFYSEISGRKEKDAFDGWDVFHYIYAIMYSPTYRSRYAEFIKIDFPRLPLTSNVALFRQLCGLGAQLVMLHLLEDEGRKTEDGGVAFVGGPLSFVEKGYPKYAAGAVFINPNSSFVGVSEEVWEFHIGGYQVCEKWLKDRRGRELSAEDIVHYQKVVLALGETIRLMAAVDVAIESAGGWPIV